MFKTTLPKMADPRFSGQKAGHLESGLYRHSVACFLGTLAVMLISSPFIEQLHHGDIIEGLMMTLVLLFAVFAVGDRHMTLVWAIILVIPAILSRWACHLWPDLISATNIPLFSFLFVMFVIVHLFRFIFRSPQVGSEVLCAGIAAYMMIGLLFALAYRLVAIAVPGSFVFTVGDANAAMKGFTAIYFSFVTLCTVGYGDIIPISGPARSLAMMEGAIGIFYVATLIARLVAMYSSKQISEEK